LHEGRLSGKRRNLQSRLLRIAAIHDLNIEWSWAGLYMDMLWSTSGQPLATVLPTLGSVLKHLKATKHGENLRGFKGLSHKSLILFGYLN
jgi:hypothetical protein